MAKALRTIRIEGQLAYVTLTKGYEVVVDAADVPLVDRFHWHALTTMNGPVYAASNQKRPDGRRHVILMHRLLMGEPDALVDHRDCNAFNNRRNNLRIATYAENSRNARLRKDNTSGFRGVSWIERLQKWQARIRVDDSLIYLGVFQDISSAATAYAEAATLYHGAFRRLK